jgi:hypothetical protein
MNWTAIHVLLTAALAAAGLLNYILLLRIKMAISEEHLTMQDWARLELAPKNETERRFHRIERILKIDG